MFLTPHDVAKATSLDRRTIYRLIHTKALPAYKIGGSVRIRQDDFDAWLQQNLV